MVSEDTALSGLTVLDLADQKGVYCTKLLADLGADVIKVEPPGGDPTRTIGPFYHNEPHPEKSLYFFHFNTNKRSVTLDLNTAGGRDAFKKLVAKADILVETFPPGHLEQMGLGYETLKALNPALIVTSITGFGQTGPWKDYKSSDLVALASSGLLSMCGWPDLPPLRMAGSQAYYMGSVQAAVGTLMALYHRLATGEGQHVDVSLQQSIPVCMQTATVVYEKTKQIRERGGSGLAQAGQGIFPCKDGYVDVGQLSGISWWERFVEWLDSNGVAADLKGEKWQDPFYRTGSEAMARVNQVLRDFFKEHTKEEIYHQGQQHGVVIGPVNTPEDIANDACLKERQFFVSVAHPELGATLRYLGGPYRLSATPWRINRRAPLFGEHNGEILGKEPGASLPGTTSLERSGVASAVIPNSFRNLTVGLPGEMLKRPESSSGSHDRHANQSSSSGHPGRLPLEGIRVVEFSEQVAGPMAGKGLADYGAQVILVENEARVRKGSSSRHPGTGAANLSSLNLGNHFNKFYTNKLSVTLDLKRTKGIELARRLISKSDVVISNFVPRVLENWGFTYAALKEIKPDIILLTLPAFDTKGKYKDYRTLSWNLMAMCGLDYASGFPDRPPIRASPWSHPDTSSQPFHALVGTLAALYWRARTGKGQHVEVCQYESTLCFSETYVFEYLVNGVLPERMGNHLDYAAPHGVYRCQGEDRWCAIAVFTDEEWRAFCQVIGRRDLTEDERFASLESRVSHADELDRITNRWTEGKPAWEVMALMQAAGIAAGVVESVEDVVVRDPQLQARNHWLHIEHPEAGKIINEDWGFRLSAVPALRWRHAPLLGEHSDFVLTQILGLPESEVNRLIIEGVIS